jgi:hypothetical protein
VVVYESKCNEVLEVVIDSIKKIKEKIKLHNWAQEIEAYNSSELNVKDWIIIRQDS